MAERNGLLNRRTSKGYRGFESLSLRSLGVGVGVSVAGEEIMEMKF